MRKLKLAATMVIGGASFVTGSHFYARTWVAVEDAAISRFREVKYQMSIRAAEAIGYERPIPRLDLQTARDLVTNEALSQGVNPSLARSLLRVESAENPLAVSEVGAIGLMQVMPVNAKRCGLRKEELFIPHKNIRCGVKLFKEDLIATNWHPVAAAERYNGGPKCVGGHCAESINHARKVLTTLAKDTDERPPVEALTSADRRELTDLVNRVGRRG